MKISKKQIKSHFKNAKEVKCLSDGKIYNISNIKEWDFTQFDNDIDYAYIDLKEKQNGELTVCVYSSEKFAEIISSLNYEIY